MEQTGANSLAENLLRGGIEHIKEFRCVRLHVATIHVKRQYGHFLCALFPIPVVFLHSLSDTPGSKDLYLYKNSP
jgi:hypothetical protein